ncbi:ankyrin [Penicillium capsulatum]|uniref:Ankyrin n=1 Tax=Penicillium capsulatum TaxID=69766 RepID=A0A9W9ICS8_9EURO|nr:ankyrin [Penicillium capsulatum]KAJ6135037.1 ankyrin [Penicillium capsulatum]
MDHESRAMITCVTSSSREKAHILDLPNEVLHLIIGYLSYGTEVSALAQTCRSLCGIANAVLYSRFARFYSPYTLERIVKEGNEAAFHKLHSAGISFDRYVAMVGSCQLSYEAASYGRNNMIRALVQFHGPSILLGFLCDDPEDSFYILHSPLSVAAERGHLETVKLLFKMGSPVEDNKEALLAASMRGHLSIVKFLVGAGVPFHSDNGEPKCPLFDAICHGHVDVVKFLIASGADANLTSNRSLRLAVGRNYLDLPDLQDLVHAGVWLDMQQPSSCKRLAELAILIAAQPQGTKCLVKLFRGMRNLNLRIIHSTPEDRWYLLCYAAATGDRVLINSIFRTGYDTVPSNVSPLVIAAHRGDSSLVGFLIKEFKSHREPALDRQISCAMTTALGKNQYQVVQVILDNGTKHGKKFLTADTFEEAIRFHYSDSLNYLLNTGALAMLDDQWEFILRKGIKEDNLKVFEKFLDDKHIGPWYRWLQSSDHQGVNIAEYAATVGASHCFKEMINRGLRLDRRDPDSHALLEAVACGKAPDLIRFFLQKGFDANSEVLGLPLILQLSCRNPQWSKCERFCEAFRALLNHGADVNAQDTHGQTTLTRILGNGSKKLVEFLLLRGADPLLGFERNASALQRAIELRHPDILEAILDSISSQGLHISNFLSLIPDRDEEWEQEIPKESGSTIYGDKYMVIKMLEQYYWRAVYPVPRG